MKRVILPLLVLFGLSALFALESAPSDVVGYIQYTIAVNDFAFVSVPFGTDWTMASDLGNDMGADVTSIIRWNAGAWEQYVPGFSSSDYDIAEGNSYLVFNDNDTEALTWYAEGVVGDAAAFDIVAGDFTQIMLPLDRSDLTLASELATNIGEDVTSVITWSAGAWAQYIPGFSSSDYSIGISDGFLVYSETAYPGWNGAVVRNQVRVEAQNVNVAKKEIKE